ncbi:MAG: ABC transporter permease [Stenomitos frigidus ULC029]
MLKAPPPSRKRYLMPSVFWGIRQNLPRWLKIVISITALLVPLVVWSFLSYGGWVTPIFLPTPTAVLQAGRQMFMEENLLLDITASSYRVFLGFMVAAAVGVPIGIAMGTFQSMESLFSPIVGTVRYMPVAAFVPLIVLWLGLDEPTRITIIFLGIVFYNAIMVADAVKFIPNELLSVAYTLGANRLNVLMRVIVPAIIPSIIDTLRVNVAGAWNYLVISELIASENGLGFRVVQSQRYLQTDKVLFTIALIGLIGLLTDFAFKLLFNLVTPWAERSTT